MKNFKNFGNALSRNEMRNVFAGKLDPNSGGGSIGGSGGGYHVCGGNWCLVQSPAYTCNDGKAPTCRQYPCTDSFGLTSMDYVWACGVG